MRRDLRIREVDYPMIGTAHQSVKAIPVNPGNTYGGIAIDGDNDQVKGAAQIAAANRYDREGYEMDGLNIKAGRSRSTRFTGRK